MRFGSSSLAVSLFLAAVISPRVSSTPLTTTASTVTTLEGPNEEHDGILIHVIRTDDLVADKIKDKPLLLEKLSHLIIKVELGNDSVSVNGHSLPVLGADPAKNQQPQPLEVSVELKQVQMLKVPQDSPLVPLGLSKPELLKISDKYISEGLVGAMLSVKQEPLGVEAMRDDGVKIDAKAYKVTIGIKILELDGVHLEQTEMPPVDLLHLIVHTDPEHPEKVATMTTLAPAELSQDTNSVGQDAAGQTLPSLSDLMGGMLGSSGDLFGSAMASAMAATRESLSAAMDAAQNVASRLFGGPHHHRKPCPHHRHKGHHADHDVHKNPQPVATNPVSELAEVSQQKGPVSGSYEEKPVVKHAIPHHGGSFIRSMACFLKMVTRSSHSLILIGLSFLAFIGLIAFIRPRIQEYRDKKRSDEYERLASSEHNHIEKMEDLNYFDVVVIEASENDATVVKVDHQA